MDFRDHPMFKSLSEIRRDFHMHPELAMEEHRTTARIKEILTGLGIKLMPLDVETGAVALVEGAQPGKVLGIRADIDALPMQEMNDVPYRSQYDGVMHSCGHDCHNTVLLGVAQKLVAENTAKDIKGAVKLIFQPAEERVSGARAMIKAGVMENPAMDRIISCHMWTQLKVGEIGLYKGPSHAAADEFTLTIQGEGAHGAAPHMSLDPIVAGAHYVAAVQTLVSRNTAPIDTAVVTVAEFHAGTASNIIPEKAVLRGTVRTFKEETRHMIIRRMGELARSLGSGFGVKADLEYMEGVPACQSDPEVAEFMFEAAAKVVGRDHVHWLTPQTGAEDFALFSELVPGAMMRLGCSDPASDTVLAGHSPYFDVDEGVLPIGVEVFHQAIRDYLAG